MVKCLPRFLQNTTVVSPGGALSHTKTRYLTANHRPEQHTIDQLQDGELQHCSHLNMKKVRDLNVKHKQSTFL